MKQNFKVFIVALLIGGIVTYLVAYKFDKRIITEALEPKVTYFYVGSYNNIEAAQNKKNNYKNAIIYNDKGIYKIIIGVYQDKDVISLMSSYFNDLNINFKEDTLKINGDFIKAINSYELLIKTSEVTYYDSINNSILKVFNEYL